MDRRLKRSLVNLSLLAVSLGFALLLGEVGLRLAGISYPSFYTRDWDRGFTLRPGAEGWWRKEGEAFIHINSDGLRDREHSVAAPPDTVRIAVLGDSYAEALQVPLEKAFWAVLERELARCPALGGKTVEVINFGVSGYTTAQELLTLRQHAWKYGPQVVLLAFVTGNDIRDNARALAQDSRRPYFLYEGDSLVLDDAYRRSLDFRLVSALQTPVVIKLLERSRLLQLVNEARNRFITWRSAARQATMAGDGAAEGAELGLDSMVYVPPQDPSWEEAWRVTEGLLLLMRDEVWAQGAEFWIVTLTNGIQVNPDPARRRAFRERLGAETLLYPDLRIRALAEQEGVPVITLAVEFRAYAEAHKLFLHGFDNATPGAGHWNARGHRLAGEIIAAQLCAAMPAQERKG